MVDKKILEDLKKVSTDSLWSILDRLGYPDTFMTGLEVIRPELMMVGQATTVRYVPVRKDIQEQLQKKGYPVHQQAVEAANPGDILVVDADGCTEAGFVGDVIMTRFVVRGGGGLVVNGAIRDLSALSKMDLPLYIKGAHASGSARRIVGIEMNVTVSCGGVAVVPGDVLLGDAQGVIVIPQELSSQVAQEALALEHTESFLKAKLKEDGHRKIFETYPPDEATLREYEEWKRKGKQSISKGR